MDSNKNYNQDGYQKGFTDGKRTGGKIKKAYIENFLKEETRNLSSENSMEFMKEIGRASCRERVLFAV